ncbi:hypothetical protein [Haploplasma axanthum]|uniref:DUF5011 domain-containing protein n=1 Tax=Haploplasma axanthum TaxID=29552 RepID=A0A449BBW1_HAPAX|nr:hypothetical protein [Haploplasma axanthum]VEU79933.1 Uncharacterised protein [Haploplasma axanthum]
MKLVKFLVSVAVITLSAFMLVGCRDKEVPVKEEDKSEIIFTGTKDWSYTLGEEKPDFYSGVTAKDGNGNEYQVLVDGYSIPNDKTGEYSVYYKAVDNDYKTLAIKEQKVVITANQEVKDKTAFIQGLNFGTLLSNNTKLELKVNIPLLDTPNPDPAKGGVGIRLRDIQISVVAYANLSTYDQANANVNINIKAGSLNMMGYFPNGTKMIMTGPEGLNPEDKRNWFENLDLDINLVVKDGNVYESVVGDIVVYEEDTKLYDVISSFGMYIPKEGKAIVEALTPLLEDHKEYVENGFTLEQFTQTKEILGLITGFLPYLITEDVIYSSPFEIEIKDDILVIDKMKNISLLPDLGMALPIPNLNLPILSLLGVENFSIKLDGTDGNFNSLDIAAKVKDITFSLVLATKDVTIPESDVTEYQKVDELRLITAIKTIMNPAVEPEVTE